MIAKYGFPIRGCWDVYEKSSIANSIRVDCQFCVLCKPLFESWTTYEHAADSDLVMYVKP